MADILNLEHYSQLTHTSFDVCLDKGTYDAVSLDPSGAEKRRSQYVESVASLIKNGGVFLITSCNWTREELIARFGDGRASSVNVYFGRLFFNSIKFTFSIIPPQQQLSGLMIKFSSVDTNGAEEVSFLVRFNACKWYTCTFGMGKIRSSGVSL